MTATSPLATDEPALTAAKQITVALVALTVAWVLAGALAPDPTVDGEGARSLLTMPFVAACSAVVALFLVNAFAFDESQLSSLDGRGLMAAISAGAMWFVLGVLTTDSFSFSTVLHFAFAAVLVAAMVGAVVILAQLFVRKIEVANPTTE